MAYGTYLVDADIFFLYFVMNLYVNTHKYYFGILDLK